MRRIGPVQGEAMCSEQSFDNHDSFYVPSLAMVQLTWDTTRNPPGQVFHLSAHRALAELVAVAGFGPGTWHHHRWLAAVGNPAAADLRGAPAAQSSGGFASG